MKPYFIYGVHASDRDLITSTTTYSGQHKRYFSSLDAEVFFGNERILDIVRIDFSYEEKKLPIFGFNSFIPSRIITGQKIIQGTFIINFTESGYIPKLLEKIDASSSQSGFELLGRSCSLENKPLFAKSFDILVGYGGYQIAEENSYKATYQVIKGVHINKYEQILDTSGEPVMEVYGFIAKDLSFDGVELLGVNLGGTESTENNDDNVEESVSGIKVVEARLTKEVNELRNLCEKNKDLLGIIIDSTHNLTPGKVVSYCEFTAEYINKAEDTEINIVDYVLTDQRVDLTFAGQATYLINSYHDTILTKEITDKLRKVFEGKEQQFINCNLDMKIFHKGKEVSHKEIVNMRKDEGY